MSQPPSDRERAARRCTVCDRKSTPTDAKRATVALDFCNREWAEARAADHTQLWRGGSLGGYGDDCRAHAVDWRGRAITAERELSALRKSIEAGAAEDDEITRRVRGAARDIAKWDGVSMRDGRHLLRVIDTLRAGNREVRAALASAQAALSEACATNELLKARIARGLNDCCPMCGGHGPSGEWFDGSEVECDDCFAPLVAIVSSKYEGSRFEPGAVQCAACKGDGAKRGAGGEVLDEDCPACGGEGQFIPAAKYDGDGRSLARPDVLRATAEEATDPTKESP